MKPSLPPEPLVELVAVVRFVSKKAVWNFVQHAFVKDCFKELDLIRGRSHPQTLRSSRNPPKCGRGGHGTGLSIPSRAGRQSWFPAPPSDGLTSWPPAWNQSHRHVRFTRKRLEDSLGAFNPAYLALLNPRRLSELLLGPTQLLPDDDELPS